MGSEGGECDVGGSGRWEVRFLSLFSGIGGLDLGMERAGWECVGQCEIEPFCYAVLGKHWPNVFRWRDVCDLPTELVRYACGPIDAIVGGFACQDISVAGKGRGLGRKTRSGLTWRNAFRFIRGLRPRWVLLENVPALKTRGIDRVLRPLERCGYTCRSVVVGADDVGAPHRRKRVFIVANATGIREREPADQAIAIATGGNARHESWGGGSAVAYPECIRTGRRAHAGVASDAYEVGGGYGSGEGQPTRPSKETIPHLADSRQSRLAGRWELPIRTGEEIAMPAGGCGHFWPSRPGEPQHGWEPRRLTPKAERKPKPGLGGMPNGVSVRLDSFARKSSLKAYGNAVTPEVAEMIGLAINAVEGDAA